MARINIEDSIHRDLRFKKLIRLCGDEHKAMGLLVGAWILAQQHWIKHRSIPLQYWPEEFQILIECGLARTMDELGSVYVRGSSEQFAWLDRQSKAGKSRSQNKLKNLRQFKAEDVNQDRTTTEPTPNLSEAPTLTPTLSLTLTPTLNSSTTVLDKSKPAASEKRSELIDFFNEADLVSALPRSTLERWSALYPDEEFFKREIMKAFNWYENNPKKKPKTIRGWITALSSWFERSWKHHVVGIKGKPVTDWNEVFSD